MFRNKTTLIAVLIFILAFALRFYRLGLNPPSLDWDEASIGWNSYNLLKTGSDEYGTKFPVSIRSFNDYKPSLYTYLSTVPIAIFGLNEFSVRFISATTGILGVIGLGLLSEVVFKKRKVSLLVALLASVAPYSVQFGRVAFEAQLSLVCFVWGTYFLMRFINDKKAIWLIFSGIIFCLSLYAYHSARLIAPIFLLVIFLKYLKTFLGEWKKVALIALVCAVLMFPLVRSSLRTSSLTARYSSVILPSISGQIVTNYISHFDPRFLFVNGDGNQRHHAYGVGPLQYFELPTIVVGLISSPFIILVWLFTSPLAAAITKESPHIVRSMLMFPPLTVLSALGIYKLSKKRVLVKYLFVIILFVNSLYFFSQYFIQTPMIFAKSWQYGYKELVQSVKNDSSVNVTTAYDQPYIYFLFYGVYPNLIKNNGSFSNGFNQYTFGPDCPSKGIIVRSPEEPSCPETKLIKVINFPDGSPDFLIYKAL